MRETQIISIKELLNVREENYKKETDNIFKLYGHKLNSLVPYVINYDREVIWDSISRYSPESNVLYVYSIVKYLKGDVLQTKDGPKSVIADEFNASVRFLITMNALENKEIMEMVHEIKALQSYEKTLSPSESYEIFSNPDFNGVIDTEEFINIKTDKKIKNEDFDFSKLTQEQQIQLLYTNELFLNEKGTLN